MVSIQGWKNEVPAVQATVEPNDRVNETVWKC